MSQAKKTWFFLLMYTLAFSVLGFFIWANFRTRSFIWYSDGLRQHVVITEYTGTVLRDFLKDPIKNFPMWSWKLGYGDSFLMQFNNLGSVGDPLYLSTVFVPERYTEQLYNILVIVRFYLVGLSFIAFCRQVNIKKMPALMGSLSYAFCGFAVMAIVRHPTFSNPMMHFPLILLGIERVWQKKSPAVLILAAFLGAMAGNYFFYMLIILAFVYATARFFHYFKEKRLINYVKQIGIMGGYILLGIGLAAVIFIPAALYLLEGTRLDALRPVVDSFLHYPKSYYESFASNFALTISGDFWLILGYPLVSIFAAAVFILKKKTEGFKAVLISFLVFALVPIFAYILNGTSYIANRWIWALAFIVIFCTTKVFSSADRLGKKERIAGFLALGLYTYYMVYNLANDKLKNSYFIFIPLCLLTFGALYLFYNNEILDKIAEKLQDKIVCLKKLGSAGQLGKQAAAVLLLASVMINVAISSRSLYAKSYNDYASEFLAKGDYQQLKEENHGNLFSALDDESFWRGEKVDKITRYNDSFIQDYYGTSIYISACSGYAAKLYDDLQIQNKRLPHDFGGLNARAGLNALLGVKYFIAGNDQHGYVPYGFAPYKEDGENTVFINNNVLPIGYAMDGYILRSDYDKLGLIEKEQAMLQGVVLADDVALDKYEKVIPETKSEEIPYEIFDTENVEIAEDNVWNILPSGKVNLSFVPGKGETYVSLQNLDFDKDKEFLISIKNKDKNISMYDLRYDDYFPWRIKKDGMLFNLGEFSAEGAQEITIEFHYAGTLTFDSLKIINNDLSIFDKYIAERQQNVLENIEHSNNKVTGTITSDKPQLLTFSIPFNKGWTAKVNGEKVEMISSDTAFFAIPIEAGENKIELSFVTYGIVVSAGISGLSCAAFVFIMILFRRRRKTGINNDTGGTAAE